MTPEPSPKSDLELARKGAARLVETLAADAASLRQADYPRLPASDTAVGRERADAALQLARQVLTRLSETPTP